MKSKIQIAALRKMVCLGLLVLAFTVVAGADVISHTVSYPPGALAGWSSIDFDGDTVAELSFELYGIGHESGGVLFLDVHGSQSTEVLMVGGRLLPLQAGDSVSLTPVSGQWQATGIQNSVWTTGLLSSPEGSPTSPVQGVGMPGYGDFMGVRFLSGSDWHYGWVRFGLLDALSSPGWPSVLEYAYETFRDTPIVVPEPSTCMLVLSGCLLFRIYGQKKWMA